MKIKLNRARLMYDAQLKSPYFRLAEKNTTIVESIYKTFSNFAAFPLSNIKIKHGDSPQDFVISLVLFSGSGSLEFKINSYSAVFEHLSSEEDIGIVIECLRLLDNIYLDLTGETANVTSAGFSAWYQCDKGMDAVKRRLHDVRSKAMEIKIGLAEASEVSFVVGGSLSNYEQGWVNNFSIEQSVDPQLGDLYLNLQGRYTGTSRYASLDERHAHFESLGNSLLAAVGFEFQSNQVAG